MEPQVIISKSEYDELIEMKSKFNELFKKYTVVERIDFLSGPSGFYKIGFNIASNHETVKYLTQEIKNVKETYLSYKNTAVESAHGQYKRIFGKLFWKSLD